MIDPELAAKIYAMLGAVVRELNCYVLCMSMLRGHVTDDGSCLGWAHRRPLFDLAIRQRMGELYQGPKQFFVLDIPAIQEVAKPGHFERCVLNVALHEAAHLLPARKVIEAPDVPQVREFQAAAFATGWKESAEHDSSVADGSGHDMEFARRCAHLYSRAITAGYDVAPDWLFGMRGMGWQSSTDKYIAALGDEPTEMATANFDVIEAIKPPTAFSDLWAEDVARHKHWEKQK